MSRIKILKWQIHHRLAWRRLKRRLFGKFKMDRPHCSNAPQLPKEAAMLMADEGLCPFCHSKTTLGPSGGLSQNIFCNNVENCDSRFNLSAFSFCGNHFTLHFHGSTPEGFGR